MYQIIIFFVKISDVPATWKDVKMNKKYDGEAFPADESPFKLIGRSWN